MATRSRRAFLQSAALTAAGTLSASAPGPVSVGLAQTRLGNSRLGVKALFFDVFGTLVDWRTGVAREAEAHLKPRGYSLDWLAFADAWRGEYQPAMEEVRSGRIPFSRLDVLHRRMLNRILPRFEIKDVPEDVLQDLNLAWRRLDAWLELSSRKPFPRQQMFVGS